MAKEVTNLRQNIDFMNQLNQMYTYIQLPLKMSNKTANGELYVFTNKRSLVKENGAVSALLHLNMENLDFESKEFYVGIPILTIAFAEMLIYSGMVKEALWIHIANLIGLFFSMMFIKDKEIRKTYQSLMLLPLLRATTPG
jgi:hypothetical protein